jgi:hypothetical protein
MGGRGLRQMDIYILPRLEIKIFELVTGMFPSLASKQTWAQIHTHELYGGRVMEAMMSMST